MQSQPLDEKLIRENSGLRMPEVGVSGLPKILGLIRDDSYRDLEYPLAANTYKNMSYYPTIYAAVSVIEDTIRGIDWEVETPEGADATKSEFIQSCMDDLDRPWAEYVNEFLSILIYGFSVNEKVFKRRKKGKSKFDDNLLGWKKLPARNQQSIKRWVFDEDGQDLLGLIQSKDNVKGATLRYHGKKDLIGIPRGKFLLFRHNAKLDNPEGNSPLKGSYMPWRYVTSLEEYQAVGVSRDLGGMPVIKLPPEYMAENASQDKKDVYEYMKRVIRNINANESAGLVFPKFVDADTKSDAFGFELVTTGGGKSYDTKEIIRDYDHKILMTFLADVLILGQSGGGSFALAEEKGSLLTIKIQSILDQIVDVLNNDLIPSTFELNGWDDKVLPKIGYKAFNEDSLESISKFIQRVVSAGAMSVDEVLSDKLRGLVEVAPADSSKPLAMPTVSNSKSGEGMQEGLPSGTGSSSGNNSETNSDNSE